MYHALVLTVLALVAYVMPVAAQSNDSNQPSALQQPDVTSSSSPTASLIGLFEGEWSHPVYGRDVMEVEVTKVSKEKAEGTVKIVGGFRHTDGHVRFYNGRVTVQNNQIVLTFTRYAGSNVVNYTLRLEKNALVGTSEVLGVTSSVTLQRRM